MIVLLHQTRTPCVVIFTRDREMAAMFVAHCKTMMRDMNMAISGDWLNVMNAHRAAVSAMATMSLLSRPPVPVRMATSRTTRSRRWEA